MLTWRRKETLEREGLTATGAEDTLVHAIQFFAVFGRLQKFALRRWIVILQKGFDRFVLLVKLGHVGHQVFDNVHCSKRVSE